MNKNIQIGNKVKAIRELAKLNQIDFANKIGLSQRDVSDLENGKKKNVPEEVLYYIQKMNIDLNWFYSDDDNCYPILLPKLSPNRYDLQESSMTIANEPQEKQLIKQKPRNKVYIVNQDVRAGLLVGFSQENIEPTEVVDIPWLEKGIFYLFNVKGDSMYPTLSSGDKVLARQLEGVQDIQNGQIHVLIHTKGMLVKRLNKSLLKDGFVEYRSDNEDEYHPDKIQVKNVMGIFEVVEAITCNLGNRNKDKELVRLYKQILIQNDIKF